MNGATPAGLGVAKTRPDSDRFKGLFPDEVARDLRRHLFKGMLDAGYTKEQIAQLTGWSTRTIRRETSPRAVKTPGRPIAILEQAVEPDLTFDQELAADRYGLTSRDVRDLLGDYGPGSEYGERRDVLSFLDSIGAAR